MAKQTTKTCKFCRTDIPQKAKYCPNCTKNVSMGWYGPALIIAVLIAIAFKVTAGQ